MKRMTLLLLSLLLLPGIHLRSATESDAHMVVAADGSGDYTSLGEALKACIVLQDTATVIYIKNGTYRE